MGTTTEPGAFHPRQSFSLHPSLCVHGRNHNEMNGYELHEVLGKGAYGEVFKGVRTCDGLVVAVKKDSYGAQMAEEGIPATTLREISLLKELRHPNIVCLHEAVYSKAGRVWMAMEYMDQDMARLLSQNKSGLPPDEVHSYFRQLVKGVHYCHSRRVFHRDLKPANILVSRDGALKIGDWGLARAFSIPMRRYTHEVVTMWYRAPELLLGQQLYGTAIDMWSVGCILAEMSTGSPLFPGDSEIGQLVQIFQALGTPSEQLWAGVSDLPEFKASFPRWRPKKLAELVPALPDQLRGILAGLLTYNPVQRTSARQALQRLDEPDTTSG